MGEIASWYQLHTSLPSRSTLHICQKFQWTSKQLLKVCVIQISCRTSFFVVGMIFSLFHGHNSFCTVQCILGQQLLFKRKHRSVVPIHSHVHRKLRSLTWSLGQKKRFKFAIMLFLSSRRHSREERNGFVKEAYVVKYQGQVSVCLRVFAGFFCP